MFENNKLFDSLKSRKDGNSSIYAAYIEQTAKNVAPVLEYIRVKFPNYPSHGIDHSWRITEKVGSILSNKAIKSLSSMEIFILFLSSLFHDTGMSLYNSELDQNAMRDSHHKLSADVIHLYFENYMKGFQEYQRIENVVIFVCEAHGLTLEELVNDRRLEYEDNIDSNVIHYGVLAFLLRIGDLLDIEADRTNRLKMDLFSDTLSETSFNHNDRGLNISRFSHSPQKIEIVVIANDVNQYIIWARWFTWLKNDIEKFNALFSGIFFRLPSLKTSIINPNDANYSVKPIQMKLDDKNRLWEIITNSIYTNELDFLREIIQNAIDASLKRVYLDNNIVLENNSPRSWGIHANEITVFHSKSKKLLCVCDRGIGMDDNDIDNYLFKLSASEITANENRKFPFPGIAKFGIGFVSCLMEADRVIILSSKSKDVLYRTTLETNSNSAFIEKLSNPNGYVGTTIILALKNSYTSRRLSKYLETTFVYPSVPISFYNLEQLSICLDEDIRNKLSELIINQPYMILTYLEKIKSRIDSTIEELKYESSKITDDLGMLKKVYEPFWLYSDDLDEDDEDGYEDEDEYADKYEYEDEDLDEDEDGNEDEYLDEDEYEYEKEDEIIKNRFEEYLDTKESVKFSKMDYDALFRKLNQRLKTINESLLALKGPKRYDNHIVDVKNGEKWNCIFWDLAAFPDECMPLIIDYEQPVQLSHKTGILIVKQRMNDYKIGIEGVAINLFMISDGNIVESLILHEHSNKPKDEIELSVRDNAIQICKNGKSEQIDFNFFLLLPNQSTPLLYQKIEEYFRLKNMFVSTSNSIHSMKQYSIYQDGIYVANRMLDIFPFGVSRFLCNLTADSRLKLNASRHEFSEITQDINEWLNRSGRIIQTQLFNDLRTNFQKLGISVNNFYILLRLDDEEKYPKYYEDIFVSIEKIVRNYQTDKYRKYI